MAGHSKWSNIKRKKGKEDAKRAQVFTKIAREVMVATKEGGADPEFNPPLALAIDKAKAANMPNDNIERAIKRGSGELGGKNFEEVVYEGYGPGGIAVYVACLTDNRNRTAPEVRHAFDRGEGNLGQDGCVAYMFERKGLIGIEKGESVDEETLMLQAIDAGAEDFLVEEYGYEIITEPQDFEVVRDNLEDEGYEFAIVELTYIPENTLELEDEDDIKNMENLIEELEGLDDVQDVYHNWDMPEEDQE